MYWQFAINSAKTSFAKGSFCFNLNDWSSQSLNVDKEIRSNKASAAPFLSTEHLTVALVSSYKAYYMEEMGLAIFFH